MKQQATETLQSFAVAAAAGLLCWTTAAFAPSHHLHVHVYHAANTGAVLWDCGPGVEIQGRPGLFWEGDC